MSQNNSRRVEFGVSVDPAIVAMGVAEVSAFTAEPWRGQNIVRLGAAHSDRLHKLPPEYKVNISQ